MAADGGEAWTARPDALIIRVRLTPRAGRDALDGLESLSDGRRVLKVRVRSAPEDGKANAALIGVIAEALDTPRSSVSLASGATSRLKTIAAGGNGPELASRLVQRLAAKG